MSKSVAETRKNHQQSGHLLPIYLFSGALLSILIFNPFGVNIFELPKNQFLSFWLGASLIILSVFLLISRTAKIFYNKYICIFLGAWLLSLILSTIFSVAPYQSFFGDYGRQQGFISQIVYIGFFMFFLNFFQKEKYLNIFLKILLGISALVGVHAILQQFGILNFSTGNLVMNEFQGRSFSTLGHPNFLGQFLLFPIFAGIYFIKKSKNKSLSQWAYILFTLIFLVALFLTKNRASILGLVVAAIFLMLYSFKIKRTYKYLIAGILLAGFFVFALIFMSEIRSLISRFYLWEGSLKTFLAFPIFGSGLETFELVFQRFADAALLHLERIYYIADRAHNEYLDILVTQGIWGLGVYLTIIGSVVYLFFKRAAKKFSGISIFFSALLAILISNFFSFSLSVHYLLFVALIAILLKDLAKFHESKFFKNIFSVFIVGMIFALGIFLSINSVRTVISDIQAKNGLEDLYSGQTKQGVTEIVDALTLNPHQNDLPYYLTEVLTEIGKEESDKEILNEAEKVLNFAGKFDNYSFKYYFYFGGINIWRENFSEAEKAFSKANSLAPTDLKILKEWGIMYYLKGDYQKSLEKLELYLSLIPDYWKRKPNLKNLDAQSRYEYDNFLKDLPGFWDIFSYLAAASIKAGDKEKVEYYLQFVQ